MLNRLSLGLGGVVATAIMAFAAGAQSAPPPPADASVDPPPIAAAPVSAPEAVTPAAPQTVVDTVYVALPDEPAVLHVTRQAPPRTVILPPKRQTQTTSTPRHRERERDDENEGGEDEGEGD